LDRRRAAGEDLVVVDGRPASEYRRMTIPGSRNCPNGELPYRIAGIVPAPTTTIVVNCAGRTRGILGAEILRSVGLLNPIFALRNGTMGWQLAGLGLEFGADRLAPAGVDGPALEQLRQQAAALAQQTGVRSLSGTTAAEWLIDPNRTTFLLDVRTAEEFAQAHAACSQHAPGGQLLQATDEWVGVRGARLLLLDDRGERAPVIAAWLARAGWETAVLARGRADWPELDRTSPRPAVPTLPELAVIAPAEAAAVLQSGTHLLLDLRSSRAFRTGHIVGARWAIRPRLSAVLAGQTAGRPILLVAAEPGLARLAAIDLAETGHTALCLLTGGADDWTAAGLPLAAGEEAPSDAEAIDFLLFVHDRHGGNLDAARQYLAWEIGLVDQLDAWDRQQLTRRLSTG
jgi:rhodanese-related sulfurtransferase